MRKFGHLYFDGHDLTDYGITISGSGTYNAPERDITHYEVPGRNGDLLIDNGRFKNVIVSYPVNIEKDFTGKAKFLREFLLSHQGYFRLEDSYDTDTYRMAQFAGPITFDDIGPLNRWGKLELQFDCKPQRYLKAGDEISYTIEGTDHSDYLIAEGYMNDIMSTAFKNMMVIYDEYVTVLGGFSGSSRVLNAYYPKEKLGKRYVYGTSTESPTSESYTGGLTGRGVINDIPMHPYSYDPYFYCSTPDRWEVYESNVLVDQLYYDSMDIYNPTKFPSNPLIQIHTGGTAVSNRAVLLIGDGQTIRLNVGATVNIYGTITTVNDIFIDCNTMNAYMPYGDMLYSMNKYVTLPKKTITLEPGINTIYTNDWVEYISITPRWWTI